MSTPHSQIPLHLQDVHHSLSAASTEASLAVQKAEIDKEVEALHAMQSQYICETFNSRSDCEPAVQPSNVIGSSVTYSLQTDIAIGVAQGSINADTSLHDVSTIMVPHGCTEMENLYHQLRFVLNSPTLWEKNTA
eukprot:141487-Rhodomonas_salina.2